MGSPFKHGGITRGTDGFVNHNKIYIQFFHLPSGLTVDFKGFITDYTESYNVSFNEQEVYGRMDPIATYQGTKRKLALSWSLVAESDAEAYENWKKLQIYIKMLYPSYKKFVFGKDAAGQDFSATTLASPPLLKLKFMNLIADSSIMELEKGPLVDKMVRKIKYSDGGDARTGGLLVVPGSLNVNPQFADRGALLLPGGEPGARNIYPGASLDGGKPKHQNSVTDAQAPVVLPYEIALSTEFTVLHQHDLGFQKTIDKAAMKVVREEIKAREQMMKMPGGPVVHTKKKTLKPKAARAFIRAQIQKKKKVLSALTNTPVVDKKGFERFPYGIKEKK